MSRRPALSISLYVAGRRALVVGDAPGAAERVERLRAAGAAVERIGAAAWQADTCAGAILVLAYSGDPGRDEAITRDARARGCLVYAHDRPELSDFAMPALVRRGPLQIAIATDGAAPALARRLREELGRVIETAGARLDALLAALEGARAALPRGDARRSRLYEVASALRLRGSLEIDAPDAGDA